MWRSVTSRDGTAGCPFCARADSGQADGAFSAEWTAFSPAIDDAGHLRRLESGKNYLDDVKIHLRAQLHVTVSIAERRIRRG